MNSGFINHTVDGNKFVIYVPREIKSPAPAILFLHGRGESGTDGTKQTAIGLPHAIRTKAEEWPFIVICPQKPDFESLWPAHIKRINQSLEFAEQNHKIDPHRRYITGLSQGGHGTFQLAASLAWQFAAAAPVCGWITDPEAAKRIRQIPLWAFHGDADPVVKVEQSRTAVAAILAEGGNAKLTEFKGVTHNSWDDAYQKSGLAEWLLSHSLD